MTYSVLSASNVKIHVRHDFFILAYHCGCNHNLLESWAVSGSLGVLSCIPISLALHSVWIVKSVSIRVGYRSIQRCPKESLTPKGFAFQLGRQCRTHNNEHSVYKSSIHPNARNCFKSRGNEEELKLISFPRGPWRLSEILSSTFQFITNKACKN